MVQWKYSEKKPFCIGTKKLAENLRNHTHTVIVGGGDTVSALRTFVPNDLHKFAHISTGGGASLEYLEGKPLIGLT